MPHWMTGEEELKAKIGQLLYNTYLVERLKGEIVEKLYSKNQLSMRMELGKDRAGNDIVLDIFLNKFSSDLRGIKEDKGIPEPPRTIGKETEHPRDHDDQR